MNTQSPAAVRVYLARVRSALADLPPVEVEEIIEDVRPHMTEVALELDGTGVGPLIEQLGTPEAYAAELRAAGEYPPATEPVAVKSADRTKTSARLAVWTLGVCSVLIALSAVGAAGSLQSDVYLLVALLILPLLLSAWYVHHHGTSDIVELPEVKRFRAFFSVDHRPVSYLRSLTPAWPLVCGIVCVGLGLSLFLYRSHSGLLALLLLVAVVAAVVWTAAPLKTDRRWLWLHLPAAALVLGSAVGLASYFANAIGPHYGGTSPVSYSPPSNSDGSPALSYGTEQIDNLYAFDAQGKPLSDVYLFDGQGRPITLPRYACGEGPYSGQTITGQDNKFPHPQLQPSPGDHNWSGTCQVQNGVPFAAAIPGTTPSASPSATPSASSSPSPTPSGTAKPPATPTPATTTPAPPPAKTTTKPVG
jgi:uncharacterized membrane protein